MDAYELGNKELKPSTSMAFTFVIKALSKSAKKVVAMLALKILYSRNLFTGSAEFDELFSCSRFLGAKW